VCSTPPCMWRWLLSLSGARRTVGTGAPAERHGPACPTGHATCSCAPRMTSETASGDAVMLGSQMPFTRPAQAGLFLCRCAWHRWSPDLTDAATSRLPDLSRPASAQDLDQSCRQCSRVFASAGRRLRVSTRAGGARERHQFLWSFLWRFALPDYATRCDFMRLFRSPQSLRLATPNSFAVKRLTRDLGFVRNAEVALMVRRAGGARPVGCPG
jgi:hypothetical protein